MSMPKGIKFDHGYATATNGLGYREISEEMTSRGYKMGHSMARALFISGMEKFAEALSDLIVDDHSASDPGTIAKDPRFQSALATYLSEVEW